jgi:hypothetical protein
MVLDTLPASKRARRLADRNVSVADLVAVFEQHFKVNSALGFG